MLTKWTLEGTFEVREDVFMPRPDPHIKIVEDEVDLEYFDGSVLLPMPKEMIIPKIQTTNSRHGKFYQFTKSFECGITNETYEVSGEYTEGEFIRIPSIKENLLDKLEEDLIKKVLEAQLKLL